jgi:hypothetical protein
LELDGLGEVALLVDGLLQKSTDLFSHSLNGYFAKHGFMVRTGCANGWMDGI